MVIAILAASALGACSTGEDRVEEGALPRLVLQPDDLSPVFDRFDEGRQASADAPSGERGDAGRFGRIAGWKSRYRRSGDPRTDGPIVLESRADIFADADGAQEELGAFRRELASSGARLLRAPSNLGEEAFVAQFREASLPNVVFVTVAWRDRNTTGSVAANGFAGRLDADDVIALARLQQRRLEAEK